MQAAGCNSLDLRMCRVHALLGLQLTPCHVEFIALAMQTLELDKQLP